MNWIFYLVAILSIIPASLLSWRYLDARSDQKAWTHLLDLGAPTGARYDANMVSDLPEPARRYFNFMILPGAPLTPSVEIQMIGQIGLGNKDKPNYQPMRARQILSPPFGLIWDVSSGAISGSDGIEPKRSWTRFWLFGFIPIVRANGQDHFRSAFGRVVSEAAFWAPASLLPGSFVRWEPIDENSARAVVEFQDQSQAVDITVDHEGAPVKVLIQRWSNQNRDRVFREQPFGGYPSNYHEFEGFRLPTEVEGGNLIGTPDYFPFFKAKVTAFHLPKSAKRMNRL